MTDAPIPSPENTVAHGDPGDETANRYRYQWTWAAVACCMLLDDTEDVVEVFCEQHEDVLLKHRDGFFTGHQVKTRANDQPLWKANDESVFAACARFAGLESKYTGMFRRFCFLTNHPLYSAGNGQDLPHVLQSIKNAATVSDLAPAVTSWVRQIARDAGVTEAVAFTAMSKTVASAELPKIRDALVRLMSALSQCWAPAAEYSHATVQRAAQALIDECGRASSLEHEQLLPAYVIATLDSNEQIVARISGKRMTLERVQAVLKEGGDSAATLDGNPAQYVGPGEGSSHLLHDKLDTGGFSEVSRNSAEDLRDKADYLGITWIKKYGNSKGLSRYNHVRSLVLSDAGRAFDATQTENDGFGPAMREDLRRRFRDRRAAGDQLFDSTDDHLEGIAFSLTSVCKIVWSHRRPWESP
ncbi:MAG: dsDNA nuclease domain-containing protein [Acidobacteriaceae bacterium]